MTTREVLLAAAALIERDGWTQGGDGRDGCRRCMQVALGDVCDVERSKSGVRLYISARDRLWAHLGITSGAQWNDAPERTADDVIAALRAAAEGQA